MFNLQELLKRYEDDKEGATFSHDESAFLLRESLRNIGRKVAKGILKHRGKSRRWIIASMVMHLRKPEESQGGSGNPPKAEGTR